VQSLAEIDRILAEGAWECREPTGVAEEESGEDWVRKERIPVVFDDLNPEGEG